MAQISRCVFFGCETMADTLPISVLFLGLNVCTFEISYHQGMLPLSSPGGHGVNMTVAVALGD